MITKNSTITDYLMMLKGEINYSEPFRKFSWAPWPLASQLPFIQLSTDASGTKGIGGWFGNDIWSRKLLPTELGARIEWLEMTAIYESIQRWYNLLIGQNVLFWCDN